MSVNFHTVLDSVTVQVDGCANDARDISHTMFSQNGECSLVDWMV